MLFYSESIERLIFSASVKSAIIHLYFSFLCYEYNINEYKQYNTRREVFRTDCESVIDKVVLAKSTLLLIFSELVGIAASNFKTVPIGVPSGEIFIANVKNCV